MTTLLEQHQYNVGRSPVHEGRDALPARAPTERPVRYLAYYLPQFHRIPENDRWWGAGFTEWTNVTKALPRYVGHYQPRLPADLGFYDLRSVETLERQAELARLGGIHGFCIHNYWFGGRRILETPLNLLLANRHIDLPFCLNWANENWSRRWDGGDTDILLQQNFSAEDDLAYAESLLPAFEDPRYIRVEGRPLMMLYRPGILPDARATVERWREFFVRRGIGNPYIVMAQTFGDADPRLYGMDAAAGFPPHNVPLVWRNRWLKLLDRRFVGTAVRYDALVADTIANWPDAYRLLPGVSPQWDNEPRRSGRGTSFYGSTPQKYGAWLRASSDYATRAPSPDERIVFINAWNEWAEGAYLEPDRHYGFAYLAETARALADAGSPDRAEQRPASSARPGLQPGESVRNYVGNGARGVIKRVRKIAARR